MTRPVADLVPVGVGSVLTGPNYATARCVHPLAFLVAPDALLNECVLWSFA